MFEMSSNLMQCCSESLVRSVLSFVPFKYLLHLKENSPKCSHLVSSAVINSSIQYESLFSFNHDDTTEISSPTVLLPVFDNLGLFEPRELDAEEKKFSIVFPRHADNIKLTPSFNQFQRNFNLFTKNQLQYLNWANVVVAGGSVLASLLAPPENVDLHEYYHSTSGQFFQSDIDIFLVGITNKEQAESKVNERPTSLSLTTFR